MTPIQQLMLGVGAKKKTYMENLFNTDLWTGDGASHQVVNNINLSGDGGMVWMKSRSHANNHLLADTVRGSNKVIFPDGNAVEQTSTGYFTSFNSNGFTTGDSSYVYESGKEMAGWSFKKAKGFFDVVTYTGNGSARTISHSLGCVPGMIMVKNTSSAIDWTVWHRGAVEANATRTLCLNNNAASSSNNTYFDNGSTPPTATNFTVHTSNRVNADGETYVAYVFAGGESTAATARSVDFDGSDDYLSIPDSADFDLGNGDFTAEMWVRSTMNPTAGNFGLLGQWETGNKSWAVSWSRANQSMDGWSFKYSTDNSSETGIFGARLDDDQWHHIAVVRDSTYIKLYTDGVLSATHTHSGATFYNSGATCRVGNESYSSSEYDGKISNVRLVKGTAVYTSAFRVPTKPLTNITNTKLLCCNDSSTTGSTVTPGTITAAGGPTASSDSPFDDPAAFTFGENGDQNVIKCGSYVGSGSAGLEVNLGFEPQWVMWKRTDSSGGWYMVDSMRGIVTGGNDPYLEANQNYAENSSYSPIEVTSTGFKLTDTGNYVNGSGNSYIYLAVRRSDGYVGKPVEDATKVFAMDTGSSSATIPTIDTGFPVDFGLAKTFASSGDWLAGSRLTGIKTVYTNSSESEHNYSNQVWDSNVGFWKAIQSTYQAWAWKRHAGFDVVTWEGNAETTRFIPHSLGSVPEMILIKSRTDTVGWFVGHKALNGGTDPFGNGYYMMFDTGAETNNTIIWNATPTSTHFNVGNYSGVNGTSKDMIAMLFASISGVSAVGSYTGNGSETGPSISVGFQPRFILLKAASQGGPWRVLDSVRGMSSGNDKSLSLNSNAAQVTNFDWLDVTSTGFDIKTSDGEANANNGNYIYYAHA